MSLIEPEIRSQFSIWTDETINEYIGNIFGEIENLSLKAIDSKSLWINHLLTKRRPNIREISVILNEYLKDTIDYFIVLIDEDFAIILRSTFLPWIDICAVITVEPAYAGSEVCYWLRCSIYEASETVSQYIGILRSMASFYEILDYPDAALIDRQNYSFKSKISIAAYAKHPKRTQTLFLIPKSAADTRARRSVGLRMAGALFPFGVVGELSSDRIRELTGLKLPREVSAIALPPIGTEGFASSDPRIILEPPSSKNDDRLRWAGMSEYLNEIVQPDPAWLSDSYEMRTAQAPAIQYFRLIQLRRGVIISASIDRATADHIKFTTDQPGWDLYSPLPINDDASKLPETTQPPSIDACLEAGIGETEAVGENVFNAPPSENNASAADPRPEDELESGYPSSLSELPIWVERRLPSAIEIAPRAIRGMKKLPHPQPQRIAEALELLAGPRLALFRGDRSSAQAFHQGLATLRLRDGFSGAERLAGRTGSDYLLRHHGKACFLDRHLASNSSGFNDPKMIRIYYFYDPRSDKIVVGWLPTHLQTSKS